MAISTEDTTRARDGMVEEIPVSFLGIDRVERKVWISKERTPMERFPPCIREIISRRGPGRGKTRSSAFLAAFLAQAGWPEEEARALWTVVVEGDDAAGEERIFRKWFGRMHCPSCRTLKAKARGYPHLGLAGLDLCRPDDLCAMFHSPVAYATGTACPEEDLEKGCLKDAGRMIIAHLSSFRSGREIDVEISERESVALESLLREGEGDLHYVPRGRPRFIRKEICQPRRWLLSERL
ncbi:MAG: hypothetical protein JW986_07675 [Methanotrichaceae archaeon]|nr:hypothetical protein [Methanotrichaceae archaeon]